MRRRTWLGLGLGAATMLAAAGGGLRLLSPASAGPLSGADRAVMRSVGAAILQGSLPSAPAAREVALDAWLERIDAVVGALPSHAQRELGQLLALLASVPGRRWLAGLDEDWATASTEQVQLALQSLRVSPWALRQQAYLGLHDLVGAAYFSSPATWALVGYPGPVPV